MKLTKTCLLASLVLLAACSTSPEPETLVETQSTTTTLRIPLTKASDDAEELARGSVSTGGGLLDFNAKDGVSQIVGVRFQNVTVPQGAKITRVRLEVVGGRDDADPVRLSVSGEAAANAATFATSKYNFSSREKTAATSLWKPNFWRKGGSYKTGDLSAIVQEVVNREDWKSGNALAFFINGVGGTGKRSAISYETNVKHRPVLVVTFSTDETAPEPTPEPEPTPDPTPEPVTPEPTTPSSGQGSSCLNDRGDLIKLRGSYSDRVTVFKRKDVKIDASDLKVKNRGNAFVASFNRGSFCLSGGTYATSISRSSSWATFHGNAAIYLYRNEGTTVERVAVLNAGDGFSVKDDVPNFVIRDSYGDDLHDDFVENDRFNNGTVKNNLVDNAFTAFSCREEADRVSPRNVTVKMQNNLIALRRQSNGGSHNDLFKWGRDTKKGCRLELRDNIFVIENDNAGYINPGKDPRVDYSPLVESACKGHKNTVIYLGNDKRYLDELKKASPTCFTITDDLGIWKKARAKWFDAHPQFRKYE